MSAELKSELMDIHSELTDLFCALELVGRGLVLESDSSESTNSGSAVTIFAKHLKEQANRLNNAFIAMS